jgi:ATP-dependent helicase/nuclease subunit A
MVERVRKVLGDWSMMDDKKLRKELLEFQDQVSDEDIEKARCLFLQVLDSPGGLQIHTFHGFCHSILGRFPLESGISPGFGLVEGERVNMLSFLAEELALRLDEKSEAAIKLLSLRMGENEFFGILEKIYKDRRKFERVLGADWWLYGVNLNIYVESMWQELDVPRDWEGVQRKQIELLMDEGLERVFRKLREGVRGGKAAERVREGLDAWFLLEEDERLEGREGVWSTFFTQKNEWNSHVEKAVDKCLDAGEKGVIEAYFKEGPERLRWRYDWGTATESLLLLAKVVLDGYDRYKRNRGLLDYDDLIVRVRGLLGVAGGGQACWVHFKLDGGIRHVLVDEAQDTDRIQWEILESLVHEFYAGKGVEADEELGDRTVFVVGDEKQSIFRFRGTEPAAMDESKERLQALARGVGKEIDDVELKISFRSGGEILGYVDRVFGEEGWRAMDVPREDFLEHESFRGESEGAKGFVMVLPLCQGVGEDEEAKRGEDILAKSLVEGLEGLQGRWIVPSTGKPLRADDVLFLFRKRKKMKAVMRELQRRGWSVTTRSDEKLSEVLAVVDVVNVLQVLLSSEDDYRLACVMKSPFVGWSDDDLLEVG